MKSHTEKDEMKDLTDKRVRELMIADPAAIDSDTFRNMLDQAKIGMTYIRDREMMKRIQQGQIIRVVSFISQNQEERAEYIKVSMPNLVPELEHKI